MVERKDLPDLVHSFTADRAVFVKRTKKMSAYPQKLLVITAAMSEVKSRYSFSSFNPNKVMHAVATFGWPSSEHHAGRRVMSPNVFVFLGSRADSRRC